MSFVVVLSSGMTLTVKAEDADVAIYRAKRMGFDAVSARPKGE